MESPTRPTVFHARDVISVILGGGAGTRLFPLTKDRSKPAVPLAGKYRIVDIPISNCLNSGLKRIFLLTQFNSSSLHRHIQQSYQFDDFSNGFVEIMAAQQTPSSDAWYQGTADAVRQNLFHFANASHKYVLILSGDQLYRMNFREVLEQHIKSGADVTVATIPVSRADAGSFGIMQIDGEERITRFVEKPQEAALLDSLKMDGAVRNKLGIYGGDDLLLASMGIYVFNRDVLDKALAGKHVDFGKHIIPNLISTGRLFSYVYQGYWEDIGTIKAFFDANLDLVNEIPKFNFFDTQAPIYTHARYLPASKIVRGSFERTAIADGCIIVDAKIEHSIIGIRSRRSRRGRSSRIPSSWALTTMKRRRKTRPGSRAASRLSALARIPTSSVPSSIKMPASGRMCALTRPASRRTTTETIITSGMELSSCPRAA